ncbi:hypothetical protein Q644_09530 [Brucella intermedia 229E]|uniref:Uncharacterized protein n=1 Tax=Brucella intermedia 229E TaxID=1337887 RepID=U4VAD5_9HYPH|nr:hypothetical protein Q644_09530 [Brucella intermedia 229E]
MLLYRAVDRERAAPRVRHLFGDHVDNTAHGVRSVKRGHRAANDFDPFNGVRRWQEALFETGIAVGAGVAGALPFAVYQKQRVRAGKTANEDVLFSRGTGYSYALHIF